MIRKSGFIVLFCLIGYLAHAQIGIQVGAVGVLGEAFPTYDQTDLLGGTTGYTVGVFYSVRISNILLFQPSLNYLTKGWKDELDDGVEITVTKMTVRYLEMPLQLVYKQQKTSGFFAGIGPSVLYGLSGTRLVSIDGDETSTEYTFGNEEGQEPPLTIAINAMVGYSFGKIQLHLNYNRGITNQDADKFYGNETHLALRIGYIFGMN